MVLTHAERAERRRSIAEAVEAGASLQAAARQYRVCIVTVRDACRQHGVRLPSVTRAHRRTARSMDVLAALINTEETLAQIAARFGMHASHVQQIARDARKAGIRLGRPGYGPRKSKEGAA